MTNKTRSHRRFGRWLVNSDAVTSLSFIDYVVDHACTARRSSNRLVSDRGGFDSHCGLRAGDAPGEGRLTRNEDLASSTLVSGSTAPFVYAVRISAFHPEEAGPTPARSTTQREQAWWLHRSEEPTNVVRSHDAAPEVSHEGLRRDQGDGRWPFACLGSTTSRVRFPPP